jgi:hypothetical protein
MTNGVTVSTMSMLARLHFSLLIIRHALVPGKTPCGQYAPPLSTMSQSAPTPRTVVAGELAWYLAWPDHTLDATGCISLFFPGALPLAAPFLLFRLKRQGFSTCRAIAGRDGILLTASR